MVYYFLYETLRFFYSPLNVFQYITIRSAGALLTALLFVLVFGKYFIRWISKKQFVQVIRQDGPQTHQKKSGTPTMGGIIILVSLVISTLIWARWDNRFIWLLLFTIIYLGFLGFLDDYLKLVKRHSAGLSAKGKLIAQTSFAIAIAAYYYLYPPNPEFTTTLNVPYLKECFINLGFLYIFLSIFIVIGSSNAVNLTDGLDGLAVGIILIASATYAVFSYLTGNVKFADYLKIIYVPGSGELTVLLAALIGAGLGFLWFNTYPAEIFMGDTGSLFLGGVLGIVALTIKQEIVFILISGVFIAEIVSVILQVYSFRLYSRRIFRMAPLHHHFELSGWPETKVTIRFWIIAIILCLFALGSLKIR